mmetsp:Transcript_28895/g.46510  ORF Transcript_28895/g.46510 Transcript_28895/m.46510 type:complete len:519 (-) Transcript_28895:64-1620(-)
MSRCILGSRKKRFLSTLVFGSILSIGWFLIHFVLTVTHERDSEIINSTGRLRFHTQRIGVLTLSKAFLGGVSDIEDAFDELHCIVDGLLGNQKTTQSCAPEMLDDDVKVFLQQWVAKHIGVLRETYSRIAFLTAADLRESIVAVEEATQAVDTIVERASAASERRVSILAWISILRVITGLVWAVVVAACFGGVYKPYVTTFKRLQVIEQESRSLLGAAFDAVVAINPAPPFNVISSSDKFDHLVGQSMLGKSVLSCAEGPVEEEKLAKLLSVAGQAGHRISSWFSYLETMCWWSLVPQMSIYHKPVASMISTSWWYGRGEEQRSLKLEVLAVNRSCVGSIEEDCPTLLVVRQACCDAGDPPQEPDILEGGAVSTVRPDLPDLSHHLQIDNTSVPNAGYTAMVNSDTTETTHHERLERTTEAQTIGYRVLMNSEPTENTASTATYEGVPTSLTPRSALDDTPPPSIAHAMPRVQEASMPPTRELVVQIEHAVGSLGCNAQHIGASSSGSATPPMHGRY